MDSVEERLARVERELEAIKREKQVNDSKLGWLERVRGSFKNDPDFEEIVQLGKDLRDAELSEDNQ